MHPLLSILTREDYGDHQELVGTRFVLQLYQISLKGNCKGTLRYGRNTYDFSDGTLIFTAPGQVLEFESDFSTDPEFAGWTILFHPDLIRRSSLGRRIKEYSFFEYATHEALHVSERERLILSNLVDKIRTEIEQNIDKHSQQIININLESLLQYCLRYHDRQFYTRSDLNKDFITKFELFITDYFESGKISEHGLPSIKECGEALQISGHYLSDLLKSESGKSAKEHLDLQLVERAKSYLLGSTNTVSEIAYQLGFQYPQHFSKVFKAKTGISPSGLPVHKLGDRVSTFEEGLVA